MSGAEPGPWSLHPYSSPEWMDVGAGTSHGPFKYASLAIGADRKLIGKVEARTPAGDAFGYPQVESLEEMQANHRLMCAAPDLLAALKLCLPSNVCLTNSNIGDDVIVPLDVPMGDLRKIAAAIAKAEQAA